jgi:putative chitinase
MIFTPDRLRALCPQAELSLLSKIALALETLAPAFGVDTLLRRAHFVAQIAHESAGFTRLEESLSYSAERIRVVFPKLKDRAGELARNPEALANAVYGGRKDLGNTAPGDGWRYRGRGLIQLTGRDNYREMGTALGLELIGNPSQAAEPDIAVRIALRFFETRDCNDLADLDDVEAITKRINGGANGLAERRALTEKAKTIFTAPEPLIA